MTTQANFDFAMRVTVDNLNDTMKRFAPSHATARVLAHDAEKPYLEFLAAQVFPYLPTVTDTCTVDGETVEYIAGFDKKDPRYKATRDAYKTGVEPFWISRAESVFHDGTEITPAHAMTADTRSIAKGDYKTALMGLRELIKNNVDQEWRRLLPDFPRPDADKRSDEEIVEAFRKMYAKRQKAAREAGKPYVHDADIAAACDLLLSHADAADHAADDARGASLTQVIGIAA